MTQLEIDALIIFKDHSFLALKEFRIVKREVMESNAYIPGENDIYDDKVLDLAIEYHRKYMSRKLDKSDGRKVRTSSG